MIVNMENDVTAILVRLDSGLKKRVDQAADAAGLSTNEFVSRVLESQISTRQEIIEAILLLQEQLISVSANTAADNTVKRNGKK